MMNKTAEALEEFLQWAHAEQYTGLDDDMIDATNDWVAELTPEEVGDLAQEYWSKINNLPLTK